MHALPFVGLGLLAVVAVGVSFALALTALALLFRVGVEEVSFGWVPLRTFRVRGVRVRLCLLPLGSTVKLAPPRGGGEPDDGDGPRWPARAQLLFLLGAVAIQLAACAALLGAPALASFGRGLGQLFLPFSDRVGPWVHGLSARAGAEGITAALVVVPAVKLLAANVVHQAAAILSRPLARLLRVEPGTVASQVALFALALTGAWIWSIGAALRG
jgi:membrane-associated protease RseP (regulator of RpoE activity)